jgi:hypothetical protein
MIDKKDFIANIAANIAMDIISNFNIDDINLPVFMAPMVKKALKGIDIQQIYDIIYIRADDDLISGIYDFIVEQVAANEYNAKLGE